jgi:hypothetical protein
MCGRFGVLVLIAGLTMVGGPIPPAVVAEEPAMLSVAGRVVDEAGQPIAGADVWLPLAYEPPPGGGRTAHATSDADGRFTLTFPAEWERRPGDPNLHTTVWAFAPGRAAGAAYRVKGAGDASDVVVTLEPPARVQVAVIGPDGAPLAGARVAPASIRVAERSIDYLPPELRHLTSAVTDEHGRAVLMAVPAGNRLHQVEVVSESFGPQQFAVRTLSDDASIGMHTLHVREVGKVEGRIIADRPEWARNANIRIGSRRKAQRTARTEAVGMILTRSDESGRFVAPALASGELHLSISIDPELPVRPRWTDPLTVEPGKTTTVDVTLAPTVTVRGMVRRQETEAPVPEAKLFVRHGNSLTENATTDESGRFMLRVLPGELRISIEPPSDDLMRPERAREFLVPEEAPDQVVELPPIDLAPARLVSGRAVDGQGQPLADRVIVVHPPSQFPSSGQTDANGRFAIGHLPRDGDLTYSAQFDRHEIPLMIESEDPLLLSLPADLRPAAPVVGHVVDQAGRPLAGAAVEIYCQEDTVLPSGSPGITRRRAASAITGADGAFRATVIARANMTFRIQVSQGQGLPASGKWLVLSDETTDLGTVVTELLRTVHGRVVDPSGRPIPQALVRNMGNRSPWTSVVTDDQGRFQLDGVEAGRVLLFVQGDDIPFQIASVDVADELLDLVVLDRAALAAAWAAERARALTPEVRATLARQALGDYADEVLVRGSRDEQTPVVELLARLDPAAAWEKLQAADPVWSIDAVRVTVSKWLERNRAADAWQVATTIQNAAMRRRQLLSLVDEGADADSRLRLLAEVLLDARQDRDPTSRMFGLVDVAPRLLSSGRQDAARQALDDAVLLAQELDNGRDPPAYITLVIGPLAAVDLQRARELADAVSDPSTRDTMYGRMVRQLFTSDLDAAGELLQSMYSPRFSPTSSALRAEFAGALALVDLVRARQMAASLDELSHRAMALALMADVVPDDARAAELLVESLEQFEEAARQPDEYYSSRGYVAELAAWSLAILDRRDPDRLPELAARVAALRRAPIQSRMSSFESTSSRERLAVQSDATLGAFLSRYNATLARAVADRAFQNIVEGASASSADPYDWKRDWTGLALIDPQRAIELIEQLPAPEDLDPRSPRHEARLAIARALFLDEEEWTALLVRGRHRLDDLIIKE